MKLLIFVSSLGLGLAIALGAPESAPRLQAFSPQGTVKQVGQVTATFSEAMVRFGDPRLPPVFDVNCPVDGVARWVDTRHWVYDFAKTLPAGIRCSFTLRGDARTLAGKKLEGDREFAFSTGGPAVVRSRPYEGSHGVNEDQIFILTLDAEPDLDSVEKLASFAVEGITEKVGARLVTGKDRKTLLKLEWMKDAGPEVVLLEAKQKFPEDAKVSLVWGKGIKSKTGVATEEDQILPFKTRKAFTAEFSCDRENAEANCIPVGTLSVRFSAGVKSADAEKIRLRFADGRAVAPEPVKDDEGTVHHVAFKGPFPEKAEIIVDIPRELSDEAGRKLQNAARFPLKVRTDAYPPLAKFSAPFGILELDGAPKLPVTVRSLEPEVQSRLLRIGKKEGILESVKGYLEKLRGQKAKVAVKDRGDILYWLRRVQTHEREFTIFGPEHRRTWKHGQELFEETPLPEPVSPKRFSLPRKESAKSFEVVGIPMEEPGFYVVEIESTSLGASLLGKSAPMYVPAAVLVTNLAVHLKWGRESSLAWVTELSTGRPVPGASVEVRDCQSKILWQGKTDALGTTHMEGLPKQTATCKERGGYHGLNTGLLVIAEKDKDMAFVHTSWEEGIERWRFNLPSDYRGSPHVAHTILDRSLFRAGDTVHMKHVLRKHTGRGLEGMAESERPKTLKISHEGSEQSYTLPLVWDANGIAESTWTIPKEAKLGGYEMSLVTDTKKRYGGGWPTGRFQVEEFRVPLMRATVQPPATPVVAASDFPVDVSVAYLSGGGAGGLPVKLRTDVTATREWAFPDFEDFTFANGAVKEGRTKRSDEDTDSESEGQSGAKSTVRTQEATLDKAGTGRLTVSKVPREAHPVEVLAELEYRDPNGESQTVAARVPVFPARRLVGVKLDSWAGSKDDLRFHVAVADVNGKAVPGAKVAVELFQRETHSHRKRILGGFYAYEHFEEVKKAGSFCDGETNARGILICQGKSPVSGNVILQAATKDPEGRESVANREIWIAGERDWWFAVSDSDRMDVLPEKKRYEPGQTAKLQVRMPFREATALVTVEREGVMETFVQKLSGKSPYVDVPVRANYAPNVYVSVLAVRGRTGGVQPTALVDLGRPAFKLGVAELQVGWKAHELKVKVAADKAVYRVRNKAKVKIAVRTADGAVPAGPTEVAVAAVDEGLLELMPNGTWKLLDAMMGRRPYEVDTATAQMYVVGKRHFGLKALPSGGGGGNQPTRELFDTLLLWKGRVKTDARGDATVEVPLNDSITSFKIVAVALSGAQQFGTGATSVRTTQDLMIFSGLPPVARTGDKVQAQFTLRNTTEKPMEVTAAGVIQGLPDALKPVTATLAPGEAREISWDVVVPPGVTSLAYELKAQASRGGRPSAGDKIKITQKIVPAVPVRTYQATIEPLEGRRAIPVERPKDALPGQGGIRVELSPTLLKSTAGIREYMTAYPYSCFEQETSRAVSLRDKSLWDKLMKRAPSYLDSDGLVKYWPPMLFGSEVLTAYVVSVAAAAGWEIPSDIESRMLQGLKGFVEGSVKRWSELPTADLSIRKLAAVEALTRNGKLKVKADILQSMTLEPNLWPTSAVIDWWNILRRMADIPDRQRKLEQADGILRARLNFQGTTMGFSTDTSDRLWWLMVSNDLNAVKALLSLAESDAWREDMPRIARGTLGRQHKGHWDLTLANAWGVLALEKFSKTFESVPVTGSSLADLDGKVETRAWSEPAPEKPAILPWPEGKKDLVLSHAGTGKPWVIYQALAAIPLKDELWAGFRVEKTIRALERKASGKWSRGDTARVTLKVSAQADMSWVVVEDPIPAGASVLGTGLGRDSQIATKGEKREGWVRPAFEERSFEAFRSYYELVTKGDFTVEYTVRLNNAGEFQLPPTRVEAMYSPEMFGEKPNETWEVAN